MNPGLGQPLPCPDRPAAGGLLAEAGLVLIGGLVFALAANALSPRGLNLARDYFPRLVKPAGPPALASAPPTASDGGVAAAAVARLAAKGLQAIGLKQADQLFREAQTAPETILFVDARDDANYEAGHIPGAYPLDYYHPENDLPRVVQACQNSETVVVYCHGGDCEDSEFAAVMLRQAGVPAARLRVYTGGFNEWTNHRMPVETGARLRGKGSAAKP